MQSSISVGFLRSFLRSENDHGGRPFLTIFLGYRNTASLNESVVVPSEISIWELERMARRYVKMDREEPRRARSFELYRRGSFGRSAVALLGSDRSLRLGCGKVRETWRSVSPTSSRIQSIPRVAKRPWLCQGALFRYTRLIQSNGHGSPRTVARGSV